MARKISIKITRNAYGNLRGHMTGQPVQMLGDDRQAAAAWVLDTLQANPGAVLLPTSEVAMDEVDTYRAALERAAAHLARYR